MNGTPNPLQIHNSFNPTASKQPSNTPKKVQPFNKNPQQNSEGPKNPKNKGWLVCDFIFHYSHKSLNQNKFSNTKKPVLSIQIYSDRLLLIAGPFNLFDEALKTLIKVTYPLILFCLPRM